MPVIRKIWTPCGERPEVEIYPRYKWFYVCSAVEPSTAEHFTLLWSTMNLNTMQYWLDSFSEYLDEDLAVLVCDRAGWHNQKGLLWPGNVYPCYIPSYSPECNPSERLWTWIKERIALQVFDDIEQLKDKVIQIINDWDKYKDLLISMLNFHWWDKAIKLEI